MTRKFFSIVFAAIISVSAFAQAATGTSTVPQNVKDAFRTQYPNVNAADVNWSEEGGFFKPVFPYKGASTTAYIDLKGRVIQTIIKIMPTALPAAAATYITQNYAGAQISEAGRIEYPNGHAARYYATVTDKQLVFDENGSFVKITANVLKQ